MTTTSADAAASNDVARALFAPWRALVRLHRDLERSTWGRLLLSNAWPAYVFALPLVARTWVLLNKGVNLAPAPGESMLHAQARLAQEAATTVFMILVVALFLVRRSVIGRRANWRAGLVAITGTFILNVIGFLDLPKGTSTELLLVSTLVILLGTVLTCWSLLTLGRCFGLLPEVRGLVMRGPYRFVRHPVYLFELVSGFGVVLAKPHLLSAVLFVLFVAFQYWRTVFEERALAEAFPEQYPAYQARTGRLLPRWR